MRVRFASFAAVGFAALLVLILAMNVVGQDKAGKASQKAPQLSNIQGLVERIGKDISTITVRTRTSENVPRLVMRDVVYSAQTQFKYGHSDKNTAGSIDRVKATNYITCVGTFDAKNRLVATECIYREEKDK